MIFAACSTVFGVIGPKILGRATTALSEGLMEKIRGTGGIDFARIGQILLFVLGLYVLSAVFTFIQGWIMTGVTQKLCYRLRKEISEKINRMPMKYFESRTYGEVRASQMTSIRSDRGLTRVSQRSLHQWRR